MAIYFTFVVASTDEGVEEQPRLAEVDEEPPVQVLLLTEDAFTATHLAVAYPTIASARCRRRPSVILATLVGARYGPTSMSSGRAQRASTRASKTRSFLVSSRDPKPQGMLNSRTVFYTDFD